MAHTMALPPTALTPAVAASQPLFSPHPQKLRGTPFCIAAPTQCARGSPALQAAGARRAVRAAAVSESENGALPQAGQQQQGQEGQEGQEEQGVDPVLEEARRRKAEWQAPAPSRVETILDVLFVFGGLLDRPFGSGQSIAAAGRVVLARIEQEMDALRCEDEGGAAAAAAMRTGAAAVPRSGLEGVAADTTEGEGQARRGGAGNRQQVLFELVRMVQLLAVDVQMVGAAVKEETLLKRLEEAKSHCQLAMRLVKSL
ncbi:hypothetical protein CLOM_g22386 [Closterium sp. NIES-68]|nr:hypothetical protein CLOM_g22386 [Closterium sp. NIES-68]GJP77827.1 hypothetical protein CLOP_g8165 [Closterium sp. NIES-67]